MIAIIFSCALLVSSYTDVCIAKRTWDGKELRPPSLRKPPREALTPGRPQRQTLSQKWTGEVNPDLPGVNLPGVKHLVRHPRMFKPPEANYTIVHSTQEYQEILSQATGHNIYIRFHESLHFVDVGSLRQHMATNIALAPNVTLVLDCQGGAVISDPLQPFPEPNEGSFFDGYGCVWFGSGQGEGSLAAAMRLSDLWLLHPCAGDLEADYADDEPTELTRLLTEDGPVHFQASDSAWFGSLKIEMRNVTMSCAAYEDIQKDMALIRQDTGISVVPACVSCCVVLIALKLWKRARLQRQTGSSVKSCPSTQHSSGPGLSPRSSGTPVPQPFPASQGRTQAGSQTDLPSISYRLPQWPPGASTPAPVISQPPGAEKADQQAAGCKVKEVSEVVKVHEVSVDAGVLSSSPERPLSGSKREQAAVGVESVLHATESSGVTTWKSGVRKLQQNASRGNVAAQHPRAKSLKSGGVEHLGKLADGGPAATKAPRWHSASLSNSFSHSLSHSRRHSSTDAPSLPIITDASSHTSYDPHTDGDDPRNPLATPLVPPTRRHCPDCGNVALLPNSAASGNSQQRTSNNQDRSDALNVVNTLCSTCSHQRALEPVSISIRDTYETLDTTGGSVASDSTTATTMPALVAACDTAAAEKEKQVQQTQHQGSRDRAESTGSPSVLSMNSLSSCPPSTTAARRTEMIESLQFMGHAVWRARWNGEPAVVKRVTMVVAGAHDAANVADAAQVVATGVQKVFHPNIVSTRAANVVSKDTRGTHGVHIGLVQELCLGGTLAGFMQSGGLTTALGGVHIQRILSLLLDMAHGIMHLHACGHTGGDVDPSHVWLQLQESEDAGQGTTLNSIDESSIDTGPPNHVGLPARMHALQRATNSSGRSAVARSADSDGGPSSLPHAVMATGSSTATLDAYGAARMAVEFDTRWRPDYSSVGPLVGTGRCVAKIAECGWCVAKGCARKSSVAASVPQAYWSPERKLRGVQGPKTHVFSFGCMMWDLYVSQKPRLRPGSKRHPHLGKFPVSTPQSYAVLAGACMAPMAADRPSTVGIVESLMDIRKEVASKVYVDLAGTPQRSDRLAYKLDRRHLIDPGLAMASATAAQAAAAAGSTAPTQPTLSTARPPVLSVPTGGAPSPLGTAPVAPTDSNGAAAATDSTAPPAPLDLAGAAPAPAGAAAPVSDAATEAQQLPSSAADLTAPDTTPPEAAYTAAAPDGVLPGSIDGFVPHGLDLTAGTEAADSRSVLSAAPSQSSEVEFPPCAHPTPTSTPTPFSWRTPFQPPKRPQ